MRKILISLMLMIAASAFAQTGTVQNKCFLGGTKAVTSGLSSSNYLDGIIPSCTVTVYLTGTLTKATIYSDNISTPLANPFTAHNAASVNPGGWLFWAATGQGLDVVMSGGIAPNTYPAPVTLTDVFPDGSGGSGGGGLASVANIAALRVYNGTGTINLVGYYSATVDSPPDGGSGQFTDIGVGSAGDDDGGVTIYDSQTGHDWRRQFTNHEISVQWFGAKGNCSIGGSTASCFDNLIPIQNCHNYVYTTGSSMLFPAAQSSFPTVYWMSGTLQFKGVSMTGPVTGDVVYARVGLRGSPSKDVIAPGDPTTVGYVRPDPFFHWNNLTLIIDDSVDASASFPNRLPGKSVFDGAINSSSAVLTSATMLFAPGDVGNAIRVYGAGAAGGNLDTTIASWQSYSQVTLAATASTTVSANGHIYLSIKGLSVTQTVGNCALAYDDYSSTGYQEHGVNKATFDNVDIITIDNTSRNRTCGMFFQGAAGTYNTVWNHNYIAGEDFGMVFTNTTANATQTALADLNVFRDGLIGATYEWISYGGIGNTIENIQLFGKQGPHILLAPNSAGAPYPTNWALDVPEQEGASAGDISYRISGLRHKVNRLESSGSTILQWDASDSKVDSYTMNESQVNTAGSNNSFTITDFPLGNSVTYSNTGSGNKFKTLLCPQGSTRCPNKPQFVGGDVSQFAASYGTPSLSRSSIEFDRTADFLNSGPEAPFFNKEDMWLWPKDVSATGGYTTTTSPDATAYTGDVLLVNNTGYILSGTRTAGWYYGKQFPSKKVRFIVKAKASASITGWTAALATSSGGITTICTITMNLTTSFQIGSCDGDASSYDSTSVYMSLAASGDNAKQVQIDWLGVKPWDTLLGNTLQVGGGVQLTSTGAASSGHAMCWKTATSLGYCSTVVDSGGLCTCN